MILSKALEQPPNGLWGEVVLLAAVSKVDNGLWTLAKDEYFVNIIPIMLWLMQKVSGVSSCVWNHSFTTCFVTDSVVYSVVGSELRFRTQTKRTSLTGVAKHKSYSIKCEALHCGTLLLFFFFHFWAHSTEHTFQLKTGHSLFYCQWFGVF